MPSPSASLATLRPDLAASLMEFDLAMDRLGFIGYKLLPVIEVGLQADTFGKIKLEALLRDVETKRTDRGGYQRDDFDFTTDNYATQEYGREGVVDDREAKRYASYFDFEQIVAERTFDLVLRAAELRAVDALTNGTDWTGVYDDAVGTAWTDSDNATPIDDVDAACEKIWERTGKWPDTVAMERRTFRALRRTSQIIDAVASQGAGGDVRPGSITAQQIAVCFDVRQVLVAGSAHNTAKAGQTRAINSLWPKDKVQVCRVGMTNDIQEPCIGRVFHWAEDGSVIGGTVEEYRDETVRGNVHRVRHDVHEKILYQAMGNVLTGVNP